MPYDRISHIPHHYFMIKTDAQATMNIFLSTYVKQKVCKSFEVEKSPGYKTKL